VDTPLVGHKLIHLLTALDSQTIDWGAARFENRPPADGMISGTPTYHAPEVGPVNMIRLGGKGSY
jgi:hypothetical protein